MNPNLNKDGYTFSEIDVGDLEPSSLSEEESQSSKYLQDFIGQNGVLRPLTVVKSDDVNDSSFTVASGVDRYRVAKDVQEKIPCLVVDANDNVVMALKMLEELEE